MIDVVFRLEKDQVLKQHARQLIDKNNSDSFSTLTSINKLSLHELSDPHKDKRTAST